MEFEEKSIIPILEAKYDNFTQVERSIADFFLSNDEEKDDGRKADYSVDALSRKLFVSKASISRFAKKCGFRGYREFIYQYGESSSHVKKEIADSSKTVLDTYQELLTRTYSLMDETQIAKVIDMLGKASRVIVCGIGSSGLAAREAESRFMRIGIDIDSLTDEDRIRMQAVFCNEESLVIGISISGANEAVLYLLEKASQRGAKTVFITSRDSFFYRKFCNEVMLISSTENLDSGNVISPQFPILIMIDIIYNEYVYLNRQEKLAMHNDTLRALKSREQYLREKMEK